MIAPQKVTGDAAAQAMGARFQRASVAPENSGTSATYPTLTFLGKWQDSIRSPQTPQSVFFREGTTEERNTLFIGAERHSATHRPIDAKTLCNAALTQHHLHMNMCSIT